MEENWGRTLTQGWLKPERNQNENNHFGAWSELSLPKPVVHSKPATASCGQPTGGLLLDPFLLPRVPLSSCPPPASGPPIARTAGESESLPEPPAQQLHPPLQPKGLILLGTHPGHSEKQSLLWETLSQRCSWLGNKHGPGAQ